MNAARRRRIQKVLEGLGELRAEVALLGEEEREAADNLADSFPAAPRLDGMEEAATILETAEGTLEEVATELEEAMVS